MISCLSRLVEDSWLSKNSWINTLKLSTKN
jgi:hypothetical protein